MHGGSGSTLDEVRETLDYGVVKMNVDTDTQWAYWDGLRQFEKEKHDYLQGQIGNPTGPDKPNKKCYDPRVWIRAAEQSMTKRCQVSMDKLLCTGTYPVKIPEPGSVPVYDFKPKEGWLKSLIG